MQCAAIIPDDNARSTPWELEGSRTAAASPTAKYPRPAGSRKRRQVTSAPREGPHSFRLTSCLGTSLRPGPPWPQDAWIH
jgi:hypothetical protein